MNTDTTPPLVGEKNADHDIALRNIRLMEQWDDDEARAIVAPDFVNREAVSEPGAARHPGITGLRATYDWLHDAYDDLRWTVHETVTEGEWAAVRTTMSGRHVGPFVSYDADGRVAQVFPATGRSFAATQTHWYRLSDGKAVEHVANRDDLGQATQLGWVPPSPQFLLKAALLKRRLRRVADKTPKAPVEGSAML